MTLCYLGLGSNLRSPARQLRQALLQLRKLPRTVVTHQSKFYFSKACGVQMQPRYCNMVITIHTTLSPQQLLHHCQQIETNHQRSRKKHWAARTLDIDLLLFGERIINHPNLTVPHPEMIKRDFVLVPLLEIFPTAHLPSGKPLAAYLNHCDTYLSLPLPTNTAGQRAANIDELLRKKNA